MALKKRIFYIVSLILLLMINAWIIKERNNGFRYFPYRTYSWLYVDDSTLYLKQLEINDSIATIKYSLPLSNSGYRLHIDSLPGSQTIKPVKTELSFALSKGIHLYTFIPFDSSALPITIKIDRSDKVNEFVFCNLAGPDIETSKSGIWAVNTSTFSKAENDSAISILQKHTNVFSKNSDLEKAMELSRFVASLPNNPKGIPQGKLSEFRPLQQIHESLKCNADLACGNYTAIYYYLAIHAGLKTRTITFRGGEPTSSYAIHYYNEVFLKEQQQWVLADPLYNIYFPHDSTGRFYNAADLKKMTDVKGFSEKSVYSFYKDSVRVLPYDSVKQGHVYYHSSNADMCYLHPGIKMNPSKLATLVEFYLPRQDLSFYSDTKSNNWTKIIIKSVAMILLIINVAAVLFLVLKRKKA